MMFIAVLLLGLSIFLVILGSREHNKEMTITGVMFFIAALAAGFVSYLALSAI